RSGGSSPDERRRMVEAAPPPSGHPRRGDSGLGIVSRRRVAWNLHVEGTRCAPRRTQRRAVVNALPWTAPPGDGGPLSLHPQATTMNGYVTNIERDTLANEDYRRVLYTGKHTQLVLMTLKPGEEIGLERHEGHDQFIRIEEGTGYAQLDGERRDLEDGSIVVIPSGAEHNVVNTSDT